MPRHSKHPNMRLRGRVWYVYWSERGRQRERAISTMQALAREHLNRLRARLDRQRAGLPYQDMLLSELWRLHEERLEARVRVGDLASSSLARVRGAWAWFESWLAHQYPGLVKVSQLFEAIVQDYQLARAACVRARTVNTELALVAGAFRTAAAENRIEHSPFAGIRPLKENDSVPPCVLSPEQVAQLLRACDDEVRPYVLGAVYTGARRGELFVCRWEDVDLDAGVVWVQNIKTRRTASDRVRPVPLHPEVEADLRERLGRGPGPWSGLPRETLRRRFRAAVRLAGLPCETRFHDLRHAFGSALVSAGVPLEAIQVLLGHKDRRSTAHYSRLRLEPLRQAVNLLAPWAEGPALGSAAPRGHLVQPPERVDQQQGRMV